MFMQRKGEFFFILPVVLLDTIVAAADCHVVETLCFVCESFGLPKEDN